MWSHWFVTGDLISSTIRTTSWPRELEDLASALSCLLQAAWHQAERPHGIPLITDITNGTTPGMA